MLPFLEKALAAKPKPKKTGFSAINAKKLVKTMESMGKVITSIEATLDGSVTVSIDKPSPVVGGGGNPWDEVLK